MSREKPWSGELCIPGWIYPLWAWSTRTICRYTPLLQVQVLAFAVQELALYLDTHPEDTEALELYRQYQQLYQKVSQAYERRTFGPNHARGAGRGYITPGWTIPGPGSMPRIRGISDVQYDKKLQYPVRIRRPNPQLAKIIITQYGGPDGELGASLRYLSQRYSMPFEELKGLLTDIGTEELGHLEMIGAIVHQLTRNLKDNQFRDSGLCSLLCGPYRRRLPHGGGRLSLECRVYGRQGWPPHCRSDRGPGRRAESRATYDNI